MSMHMSLWHDQAFHFLHMSIVLHIARPTRLGNRCATLIGLGVHVRHRRKLTHLHPCLHTCLCTCPHTHTHAHGTNSHIVAARPHKEAQTHACTHACAHAARGHGGDGRPSDRQTMRRSSVPCVRDLFTKHANHMSTCARAGVHVSKTVGRKHVDRVARGLLDVCKRGHLVDACQPGVARAIGPAFDTEPCRRSHRLRACVRVRACVPMYWYYGTSRVI